MMKWINKRRNKKGFTLVELVVVIAILGILAALAIPRLSGFRDTATDATNAATARTIYSAAATAQAGGNEYTVEELASNNYLELNPNEDFGDDDNKFSVSYADDKIVVTYPTKSGTATYPE